MKGRGTLSGRLALLVSAGFTAIWLLAVLATALVLSSEQEEMLDLELRETANVLLPLLSRDFLDGGGMFGADDQPKPPAELNPEEMLVWLLSDASGRILAQSTAAKVVDRPKAPVAQGYVMTGTHVFYTTPVNADGLAVSFGDPLMERSDAFWDSFLAFLLPMLAILPLGFLLVGWIARTALRPLSELRDEIAGRGHGRLDPIDATGQPAELEAIIATLNRFMLRLSRSLEGERAFATNAAHELRTPVAIARAQIQRLRTEVTGEAAERVQKIEKALKRMGRLVSRLLQLARADAGIGMSDTVTDIAYLLRLVLDESRLDPARVERLSVSFPDRAVLARIDPDAFAIVVGNLIDNAFQHAPEGTSVEVVLSDTGVLRIRNQCEVIPAAPLADLKTRFRTTVGPSNGFGLGLHICDTIIRQAGGALILRSPAADGDAGFEVKAIIPMAGTESVNRNRNEPPLVGLTAD